MPIVSTHLPLTTLIDTSTLAAHLDDERFSVVDCRFRLDDTGWGEREYLAGHVPRAAYVHLDRDLSGPKTGTNGRHPLPDVQTFEKVASRLGIGPGVQVVAYDQDSGMFASRLWWLLRWLGHDAVAVLDGGFAKWTREHRPTRPGAESHPRREFEAVPRPELVVGVQDVTTRFRSPDWRLLDARAPERYRGETEPLDRVPGHIPGAVNHFFKRNVTEEGTFLPPDTLRGRLEQALEGTPPDHTICYCGSGVTACHNLLALEHTGLKGAKLYPGSWSEWSSDPNRPAER
jgi:thiosulfate/3-mercaptopyruvate sulfurtransferase